MRRRSVAPRSGLPHEPTAEQAVLGAVLMRNTALAEVTAIVGEDDFYTPAHRVVYKAMIKLAARGQPIDVVTLETQLRADEEFGIAGGLDGLGDLTDLYATSHNCKAHASIVRATADKRREVQALQDALDLARAGEDTTDALRDLERVRRRPEQPDQGVEVVCMANVQAAPVPWLWAGRIAIGTITLLIGDPGLGKSTVLLDLAARVSTGRPFPGPTEQREPAGVVILGAEDALDFVVRPRLDLLGADVSRVHVLKAVLDKHTRRPVSLETDLRQVEDVLARCDAQLMIVDPLSGYLGRNVNTWKDSDVRAIMDPLADMASRRAVAVVGLVHLNRATERDALHRSQGSTAFVAASRSVLALAPDPDEHDHKSRRVLVHIKCNLAPLADARMLDVSPPLQWLEERSDVKASQALTPKREERGAADRHGCEEAIRQVLEDGPLPASVARAQVHELLPDAKDRTIDRARAAVGVRIVRPAAVGGEWLWSLPGGETGSGETGGSRRIPPSEGIRPSRQGENRVARRADRVGEANGGHPPVSPLPVSPLTEMAPDLPDDAPDNGWEDLPDDEPAELEGAP